MGINYTGVRNRADRMIKRYGQTALLRRGETGYEIDRECTALEIAYTPSEKRRLQNLTDRKVLLSARNLDIPPDKELDTLVMLDQTTLDNTEPTELEVLKIIAPPGKLSPGGVVVYWELQVRG